MHKGQVVHGLAPDADDHDGAAAAHGKGGGAYAALDSRALEHGAGRDVLALAEEGADGLAVLLVRQRRVDLVRDGGGDEVLCEPEARGLNVGDDERVCARGAGGGEGDEADGTGAADDGADAEGEAGRADAVEDDGEGLEEGALLEGDVVREAVQPLGGVQLVALEGAVVGVDAGEADVGAQVVAALLAQEAGVAGDAGLDGDAVAGLEGGDALADAEDDAGGLVADDAVAFEDDGADLAGFPEVDV